eukprot:gene7145-biopygen14021
MVRGASPPNKISMNSCPVPPSTTSKIALKTLIAPRMCSHNQGLGLSDPETISASITSELSATSAAVLFLIGLDPTSPNAGMSSFVVRWPGVYPYISVDSPSSSTCREKI